MSSISSCCRICARRFVEGPQNCSGYHGSHPAPHPEDRVGKAAIALIVDVQCQICSKQFIGRWNDRSSIHRPAQLQGALKRQPHSKDMLHGLKTPYPRFNHAKLKSISAVHRQSFNGLQSSSLKYQQPVLQMARCSVLLQLTIVIIQDVHIFTSASFASTQEGTSCLHILLIILSLHVRSSV